jgi:hypothetical protein
MQIAIAFSTFADPMTGQTISSPREYRAAQDRFTRALVAELAPGDLIETALAQTVAHHAWCLQVPELSTRSRLEMFQAALASFRRMQPRQILLSTWPASPAAPQPQPTNVIPFPTGEALKSAQARAARRPQPLTGIRRQ